jgi:hypothetical protein
MRRKKTPVVTDNVLRRSDRHSKSSSTDVQEDACSWEDSTVPVSNPEEGDKWRTECCCSPSTNREAPASSQPEGNTRGLPEPPMPILPATAVCRHSAYILVPVGPSAVLSQQYGIAQSAIDFRLPSDCQPWCHKSVTVCPTPQSAIQTGTDISEADLNSIFGDAYPEGSTPYSLS